MQSRITHIATAVAVVVGLLFLARHLVGGQATIKGPDVYQTRDVNQDRLEQVQAESRRADGLLARHDVDGLVGLLQTGLDQTRLTAAQYLGRIGDSRAIAPLQSLAGQWQGSAQDNPFLKAAEQIRQRTTLPKDVNRPQQVPAGPNQPQADTRAQKEGVLLLTVVDAKTQRPVAGAGVLARLQYRRRAGDEATLTTDAFGQCLVAWAQYRPDSLMVRILSEDHVIREITWSPASHGVAIPKTYIFQLNEGVTIGGIVKTDSGEPLADVTVRVSANDGPPTPATVRDIALLGLRSVKTDDQGRWLYKHFRADAREPFVVLEHPTHVYAARYNPTPSLESLISQGCVLFMRPGLAVSGTVSDMQGHPVAGAEVFEGDMWNSKALFHPAVPAVTDSQGRFELHNLRQGQTVLTAVASGFAQDLKEVYVSDGMPPVDFSLEPGHTLRVQVVDKAGHAVTGVSVTAWSWQRGKPSNKRSGNIRGKAVTDQSGLAVIHDLPGDEVLYAISKKGFAPLNDYPLIASDKIQTVRLVSQGRVIGCVLDGRTGRSLDAYTVTLGIQWRPGEDVVWQPLESQYVTGKRYEVPFPAQNLGMAIRVEAQGYLPAETEVFFNNGTDQVRDVSVTAGTGLKGTVYDPNGAAAKGARVVIATTRWANVIRDGQVLSPEGPMHVVTTDDQGRFAFPPPDRAFKVVAVSENGIAEVDEETLRSTPEIRLEAWGRLEGVVYAGRDPVANQQVRISVCVDGVEIDPDAVRIQYDNEGQTDDQGRFLFRKVRPGPTVVQSQGRRQVVDVRTDQTLQVTLGGGGRKVRARLALPEGAAPLDHPEGQVSLRRVLEDSLPELPVPLPDDFLLTNPLQQRAWWLALFQTPEGQRFKEASERRRTEFANCMTSLEADGDLRLADILPGRYELILDFRNPDPSMWGSQPIVTSQEYVFDIPNAEGEAYYTKTLDLGEIPIRIITPVKVQSPAPPFVVYTSDGRTLRLSDLQGRFVMLDVLGEPLSQQTAARHQVLRQIHAAYSQTGRLEIISIIPYVVWPVSARMAGPLRTFAGKMQLPWTVGIVSESNRRGFYQGYYQSDAVSRLGLGHYPSCVLIGPDGIVLALDIPQDQLLDVVAKALQEP